MQVFIFIVEGKPWKNRVLRTASPGGMGRCARIAATCISAEQRRGLSTGDALRGTTSYFSPAPTNCYAAAPHFQAVKPFFHT